MDIKKIYTENGKVIKEYFVHKEDAKEVASKLGIDDDLVEKLEKMLDTDDFTVIENSNGFYLSKDGQAVSFNIIAGYLNSENINSKPIIVGDNENSTVNSEEVVDESLDEK